MKPMITRHLFSSAGIAARAKTTELRLPFLLILYISVLYGSSYNQFHHFNVNDTRGLSDTRSYLEMANGNYNVNQVHKYRFIIPGMVYCVKNIFKISNDHNILLFYIFNFIITIISAILLNLFLLKNGASALGALLGGVLFLTNRVIADAQLPLVDSLYFLGIILVVYLLSVEKYRTIIYILPLLALFKETLLLIPFLLFFRNDSLKMREFFYFTISFLLALALLISTRQYIDTLPSTNTAPHANKTFIDIVLMHFSFIKMHLLAIFSFRGANDVASAFGLLYVFLVPILLQIRKKILEIDGYLWGLLFLAVLFMILSGNAGRMLFTAYPLIYLLIAKYIDTKVSPQSRPQNI